MKSINKGKITVCACRSRKFIAPQQVACLTAQAEAQGYVVEVVADLCQLCENENTALAEIGNVLAACHPRAVATLLKWRNVAVPERLVNLREGEQLMAGADVQVSAESEAAWLQRIESLPQQWGSDAWFPTIDKSLCAECGKCLDFCPFGVYEMVDERVRVVHPHRCKNNCPACARTCPAGAIIFPKYDRSPINGGTKQEETMAPAGLTGVAQGSGSPSVLYADALRQRLQQRRLSGTPLYKVNRVEDEK